MHCSNSSVSRSRRPTSRARSFTFISCATTAATFGSISPLRVLSTLSPAAILQTLQLGIRAASGRFRSVSGSLFGTCRVMRRTVVAPVPDDTLTRLDFTGDCGTSAHARSPPHTPSREHRLKWVRALTGGMIVPYLLGLGNKAKLEDDRYLLAGVGALTPGDPARRTSRIAHAGRGMPPGNARLSGGCCAHAPP